MAVNKPQSEAQKLTKTVVETILFTREEAQDWKIPPFQRPLRVNDKVRDLSTVIANDGGIIPGILTFGMLNKVKWLLDGQHRREAFVLSEKPEGVADTRTVFLDSMAEMGEEFVRLNSRLVNMKPDDVLRGLEGSLDSIQKIRKACDYVGYDMIRRGDKGPLLSMSALLRGWEMSKRDVPGGSNSVAAMVAQNIHEDEVKALIRFTKLCYTAWGRDPEYYRLWGGLNLVVCAWTYRRIVMSTYSPKSVRITDEDFLKCLMALSADGHYLDWLMGRMLTERDRSPCYTRITAIFAKRLESELGGKKLKFPRPPWALGKKIGRRES